MPDHPDWGGARQLGQLLSTVIDLQAEESGAGTIAIVAVAGRSIVVTQLSASAGLSISPSRQLREVITYQLLSSPGAKVLATGAISPAQPSSAAPIVGDAASTAVGESVDLTVVTRQGSGKQDISVMIVYYLS